MAERGPEALLKRLLRLLIGRARTWLAPPAPPAPPEPDVFDIGDRLTLGRHSYGRPLVRWYTGDRASVRIGDFVSIADDVVFMIGGGHPPEWVSSYPFRIKFELPGAYEDGLPSSRGDIEVGSDVWIGRGARVLSGVTIGHGAVIGAYAVVARDVRPYAIVVGNPAREVRRRFADDQVDALLESRWWELPDDRLLELVPLLSSDSVERFLAALEARAGRSASRSTG